MEIIWHNNRYLHHIPQIHKDELFAWNATEDGMKSKEAYFNKIEKVRILITTSKSTSEIV